MCRLLGQAKSALGNSVRTGCLENTSTSVLAGTGIQRMSFHGSGKTDSTDCTRPPQQAPSAPAPEKSPPKPAVVVVVVASASQTEQS